MSGDKLKVARAYIDFELQDDLLFLSIGRLSTSYGPPQHLYSNTERLGTYPLMAYSIPMDGIALSYTLPSKNRDQFKHQVRVAYAPQSNSSSDPFIGSEIGNKLAETGNLYTVIYELSAKKPLGLNTPLSFIVQSFGGDLMAERETETRAVFKEDAPSDNSIYKLYGDNEKLISFKSVNAYLELNSPFKSPLDLYGSFSRTWVKRRGNLIAELDTKYTSPLIANVGDTYNLGAYYYSSNHSANKFLAGMRYKKEKQALGAEYYKSEIGSLTASPYTKRITNFYDATGEGFHIYYGHKLVGQAADLRVGYSNMLYTHEISGFAFEKSRRRQENLYTLLTVRF